MEFKGRRNSLYVALSFLGICNADKNKQRSRLCQIWSLKDAATLYMSRTAGAGILTHSGSYAWPSTILSFFVTCDASLDVQHTSNQPPAHSLCFSGIIHISLGMMVTRLAWMASRLTYSMSPTMHASIVQNTSSANTEVLLAASYSAATEKSISHDANQKVLEHVLTQELISYLLMAPMPRLPTTTRSMDRSFANTTMDSETPAAVANPTQRQSIVC
eukprot:1139059-Pelagomonas_calceolata.AAC.5